MIRFACLLTIAAATAAVATPPPNAGSTTTGSGPRSPGGAVPAATAAPSGAGHKVVKVRPKHPR